MKVMWYLKAMKKWDILRLHLYGFVYTTKFDSREPHFPIKLAIWGYAPFSDTAVYERTIKNICWSTSSDPFCQPCQVFQFLGRSPHLRFFCNDSSTMWTEPAFMNSVALRGVVIWMDCWRCPTDIRSFLDSSSLARWRASDEKLERYGRLKFMDIDIDIVLILILILISIHIYI